MVSMTSRAETERRWNSGITWPLEQPQPPSTIWILLGMRPRKRADRSGILLTIDVPGPVGTGMEWYYTPESQAHWFRNGYETNRSSSISKSMKNWFEPIRTNAERPSQYKIWHTEQARVIINRGLRTGVRRLGPKLKRILLKKRSLWIGGKCWICASQVTVKIARQSP